MRHEQDGSSLQRVDHELRAKASRSPAKRERGMRFAEVCLRRKKMPDLARAER